MESQIQIQSDSVDIVIHGSASDVGSIADRTRQQRHHAASHAASASNSTRAQQKQPQKQVNAMPRVLIVSSQSGQQNTSGPTVTTRSADRKSMGISQGSQSQTNQLHHQTLPQRQIVIHQQPSESPKLSAPVTQRSLITACQQQAATVQNGQFVVTNLSENRARQQQQQQMHRQQQILIIQQSDPRIIDDDEDKSVDLQSQDQTISLGVAQTITVAVSDPDGRVGDGGSAAIYPTLQPGTYAVYPGDAGGYSPQGHHYYPVSGQVSYQTPLHSPTSTYIIQSSGAGGIQHSPLGGGPCNPVVAVHEDEAAAQQLSHTTRASPATIQWLLQNYETAEGVSLPRCTLYNHYLKHCSEHKLDPVNAASFGKLIRSVFLGLRTRRLGTRGNSKYHYYGIRIKPDSLLNRISDDSMATMAMRQQPTNQARRPRPMLSTPPGPALQSQGGGASGTSTTSLQTSLGSASGPMSHHSQPGTNVDAGSTSGTPNSIHSNSAVATNLPLSSSNLQSIPGDGNKQYVGDGIVPDVMPPPLEHLEPSLVRLGLSTEDAGRFFSAYRNHCGDILECVKNLLFSDVERYWRQFWQPDDVHRNRDPSVLDQEVDSDLDDEDSISGQNLSGLNRMQLYSLCTLPVVQEFVQTMDFQFYQVLVDVLIPNVLKPIPSALTQSIRNFAKRLENGLGLALQGAPDVILRIKLDAVGSLAQTLRRYTSLNHLAQAARAVLQNGAQIQQMLADLNRVDFHNVQEQASWVCDCDPSLVDQIEKDFKNTLERQKTLEQWGTWLETVVDQVLGSYDILNVISGRQEHDASVVRLTTVARQFLLKWSFYSSMVMRDLTLRSAPSFGSFHLIRLLYDEYMFYLVEQRVARLTGQTTIAVMSQSYRSHIASLALASGEQDYQAYQLQQQQQLSQDHQGVETDAVERHDGVESYPNSGVDEARHQFVHHQQNDALLHPKSNDGDSSLSGLDRTSTGPVVLLASGHGELDGASAVVTIPMGIPATDIVATYVMHQNPGEGGEQEPDESNVADEFFITTTIQEEQPNKDVRVAESNVHAEPESVDAATVLSGMAAPQSTMHWDHQEQESTEKYDRTAVESSTPVKKRKVSLKYNGDANLE